MEYFSVLGERGEISPLKLVCLLSYQVEYSENASPPLESSMCMPLFPWSRACACLSSFGIEHMHASPGFSGSSELFREVLGVSVKMPWKAPVRPLRGVCSLSMGVFTGAAYISYKGIVLEVFRETPFLKEVAPHPWQDEHVSALSPGG